MSKSLKIKVLSKDEFRKLLMEHLLNDKKEWTMENMLDTLLNEGFPKLDFDDLNKTLKGLFVYIPTVAVDIGDNRFVWVVSGMNAMLVNKLDETDNK